MGGPTTVAKSKGRPKSSERDDVTVRLDRLVARRIKAVADYRGVTTAELLTELVRKPADSAFAAMVAEINKAGGK
jgi:hypothetical protein